MCHNRLCKNEKWKSEGGANLHQLNVHGHADGAEHPDGVRLPEDQGVLQREARTWVPGGRHEVGRPGRDDRRAHDHGETRSEGRDLVVHNYVDRLSAWTNCVAARNTAWGPTSSTLELKSKDSWIFLLPKPSNGPLARPIRCNVTSLGGLLAKLEKDERQKWINRVFQ